MAEDYKIVFTLQSIKSRIETSLRCFIRVLLNMFLLYSPLNQGLKQLDAVADDGLHIGFYSTVH